MTTTGDGLDLRFAVNTVAPYLLTTSLLPLLDETSRVVNLSSAAQAPVDLEALAGKSHIANDSHAYAQSKLALTMWTRHLATTIQNGPMIVAVNPASFLGSKMVKEAYGMQGKDLGIGANILTRAALSDDFADANGKYFDNDVGQFTAPHPDAMDPAKCEVVVNTIETVLSNLQ